jgi:two-component system, OmpR family, phosphate regulon response regulator PhoB
MSLGLISGRVLNMGEHAVVGSRNALRVLIVEDDDDTRRLLKIALRSRDFLVDDAGNADLAWQKIVDFLPDVVLLDVMIPGSMDGIGICERLNGADSPVRSKVIVISGKTGDDDLERGRKAQADAYILKPFSPLQMIETIDWVLKE